MAVFWVVAPRSLVEVYRFRGPDCLHHQGDLKVVGLRLLASLYLSVRL
jgi:hypothetical protein